MWKATSIGLVLALTFAEPAEADLSKAQTIGKVGNWTVLRSKNSMTDEVSCVGIYKNNYAVQLSPGRLYLSFRGRGGVQGYRYRIDDAAPTQLILATEIERRTSTISIADTKALLSGKRLRVSGLSVLETMIDEEIILDGIAGAHALLVGKECVKASAGTWAPSVRIQRP